MAAPAAAATQTYVFFINQTDVAKYAAEEFHRPLYYHSYVDLILLALLLVVSLVSNAVLATTLLTNRYLQQISSYIPILGLTLVHLLDCAFNGIISLAYMSRIVWNMGHPLCIFHNYFSHFTLGLSPLFLFLAGVDRYTCLNYPEVYRVRFTCAKHRLVLALFGLISGLMAIPYLLSLVFTRPFPARMSCASGYTEELAYVISWALFPLAVPLFFNLIIAVLVGRTLCLDRREKSRVQSRAWLDEKGIPSASSFRNPLSQNEIRSVSVWLALLAVYLCCSLPYVVHEIVHQLDSSIVKDEAEHSEVCVSPAADVFVAWFRYLATGLHSVIIFAVCEEVRQETGAMLSTWNVKPSSVIEEATTTVDDLVDAGSKSSWVKLLSKNKNGKTGDSKFTAVLFPSQLGIQMRFWNSGESKYSYCWCDHLDACCVVKAQKRKFSDSGFYSVRSEERLDPRESYYKRRHDDFDVISEPRTREINGPKANKPRIIVTESNPKQFRANNASKGTGYVNKSTGNVNKNTGNVNKSSGYVNKNTGNVNKNTGNVNKNTGNVNKNTENVNKNTGNVNKNTGNVNKNIGNVNKSTGRVNRSTGNVYKSSGWVPETGRKQVGRVRRDGQKSKSLERMPQARMTNQVRVPGRATNNLTVPKTNRKPRSRSLDRYPEQSKSYPRNSKKFN